MPAQSGGALRYLPFTSVKQGLLYLAAGVLGGASCAVYLQWRDPVPSYTWLDAAKAVASGVLMMMVGMGVVGVCSWVAGTVRRR